MSYRIAVTGKGGTGKTSLSAILVNRLNVLGCSPVLAVDADPNTCLDRALGVEAVNTVGGAREDARIIAGQGMKGGMAKHELLELKIAESLVEAEDFDLIAMGRSEGPGCYCYANNVLKAVLEKLSNAYPFVVIDNEAGLENLSRRIVRDVDMLLLVTDPSAQGVRTVERLASLAREMEVSWREMAMVVNRNRTGTVSDEMERTAERIGADHLVMVPEDAGIAELAERGDPLLLADDNPAAAAVDRFLESTVDVCEPERS